MSAQNIIQFNSNGITYEFKYVPKTYNGSLDDPEIMVQGYVCGSKGDKWPHSYIFDNHQQVHAWYES